jgi:hypothetical protein
VSTLDIAIIITGVVIGVIVICSTILAAMKICYKERE